MALEFGSFTASFNDLPTELLVKIILELDWRTVLRIQLVNTELNKIINSHIAVQYHVELGMAGMVNGPPSTHSPAFNTTAERLARLRQYRSRWTHLERTRSTTVRYVQGAIWELAGGVLAQGVASSSSSSEFVNAQTGRKEVRKLLFTRLPSATRSGCGKVREWTHGGYEFPIRDFTMDPEQDLLVLLRAGAGGAGDAMLQGGGAELHLRSLKTNEKHPRARAGTLVHKLAGGTAMKTHSLQVCRDRFAVLHKAVDGGVPEKLVVYDWKKGELLFEISFCGIMSFAFLSPRHLLFAVQPFNVMPACHGDHQPRLLICDVDRTAALSPSIGRPESYVAVCEFHLPELKQYADVVDISIRVDPASDPFSSSSSSSSSCEGTACDEEDEDGRSPTPTPAFRTASDNRLFVINLQVETVIDDIGDHRASESLTLGLFVPLSTFLPFLSPPLPSSSSSSSTTTTTEQEQEEEQATNTLTKQEKEQKQKKKHLHPHSQEYEIIPANSESTDLHFGDYAARAPRGKIAVGWEGWMREGARALLVPGAEGVWVCNVFGGRCVVGVERRDEDVPFAMRRVAVLEFGGMWGRKGAGRKEGALCEEKRGKEEAPYSDSREEKKSINVNAPSSPERGEDEQSKVLIEDYLEPSTLEASRCGIFESDVVTGFKVPYRRIVLREKVRFDGVMITEDNVVFVHSRHTKGYEVWTF